MTAGPGAWRRLDRLESASVADGPAMGSSMMELIHGRAPDGYIALERKGPDGLLDRAHRCFLPVQDLRELFPTVAEHFCRDSYHSMSLYYGAPPWQDKATGLPAMATKAKRPTWARCKENLRWLPACWVDLDCGRSAEAAAAKGRPEMAFTWRLVAYIVGEMMDARELPQATIMARSGRGLYLIWLLCDEEDRRLPVRALPSANVALMEACNRELIRRTNHLAADGIAFDATRVLRIDGSWHSGANARVQYLEQNPDIPRGHTQRDASGRHFAYTLAEMAAALSIPTSPAKLAGGTLALLDPSSKWKRKPTKQPGSKPEMKRYQQRLHAMRIDDLLALEQYRKRQTGHGFAKRGTQYPDGFEAAVYGRLAVLTIYAENLRGAGVAEAEAVAAVARMAENCGPPYPSDPTDSNPGAIIQSVYEKPFIRRHSNRTLCARLGITAELAEELQLSTLIPPELKAKRTAEAPSKADFTAARQAAIRELLARDGPRFGKLDPRRMARYLAAHDLPGARNPANGQPWSHESIRQDMDALNLARRKRPGRRSAIPSAEALLLLDQTALDGPTARSLSR